MTDHTKDTPVAPLHRDTAQRVPCVLLLDTSRSMKGQPIDALNRGLRLFADELRKDAASARQIEVAVLAYDTDVDLVQDFVPGEQFEAPSLTAQGCTRTGLALLAALDLLAARLEHYKLRHVRHTRPWVLLVTDGEPEAELDHVVRQAVQRLRLAEARGEASVHGVAVGQADVQRLAEMVLRRPMRLRDLEFPELFAWLASCLRASAHAEPGETPELPSPDWAETRAHGLAPVRRVLAAAGAVRSGIRAA